ncbi:MAG TPA: avirulence protein, partial [Kofleriaceae bacterium]
GDILIDKRLAGIDDVQAYAKMAKDTGRKFVLYDVDAPLETSLAGVLERVPGGADPLPPFKVVADGFVSVRSNRQGVIDMFTGDPSFGDYVLYGTTSSGQRVEVATVIAGKLTNKNPDLYAMAVADGTSAADALAKTRITGSSIDEMLKDLPADRAAKVGPILRKYEGWTWKAALDAHSAEKPKVP